MSSGEEQRRKAEAARNVEVALTKCGAATAAALDASKDPLVNYIKDLFETFVPGISCAGAILANLAAASILFGPVSAELITSVREDGTQSSWVQPSGDFFMFVSGPGQFKSGTMNLAVDALHDVLRAIDRLKDTLGGTIQVHGWVDHVDRDLSIFRDGSSSAWFERIKANPKLMTLAYFIDEFDIVLKRVKSDKSAGELTAWLSLWNVGAALCKNTGQINVGIHHVFSTVMACGQYFVAYDLGCDEESGGRGFAPRFIFGAGNLETRRWAFAKDVDYMKLLVSRMVNGLGALGSSAEPMCSPGTSQHCSNGFSQLMLAGLVMLHVFPTATVTALKPAQHVMNQALRLAEQAGRAGRAASMHSPASDPPHSPSQPVTPSRPCNRATAQSTPQLAAKLGFETSVEDEAESSSSQASSQSPDNNGKRKKARDSDYDGDLRSGKPRENPPTKEQADAAWAKKSPHLFFTSSAQDLLAQFCTSMDGKEREASRSPGQQSMSAYYRKAKDHVMRLLSVCHLLHLGVHLLQASGMKPCHQLKPRDALHLCETASELPHVENRYVALGDGCDDDDEPESSQSSPTARVHRSIGHLIGEDAVGTACFVVTEHLKIVGAIHTVSQSRCAPLLNMPGFFVTSTDAHASLSLSIDGFVDLCKIAHRAGAGIFLSIEPVKWKNSKGAPFAEGQDLVKSGGHALHVLVKTVVPSDPGDHAAKLRLSASLTRCGSSLSQFKTSTTQNILDSTTVSKAQQTRMQQLTKLFLAAAHAAKRIDLLLPREDGLSWADTMRETCEEAMKPSFWADETRLRDAHAHLAQLAILAHNAKPAQGLDKSLEPMNAPFVPPEVAAAAPEAAAAAPEAAAPAAMEGLEE